MLLFIIFVLSILIILGYSITHKNILVVVINILVLLIITVIELMRLTLGATNYYLVGTILTSIIQIAMIVLVIKNIVKYIRNKQLSKREAIGTILIIILFAIYSIAISINRGSAPVLENEIEKEKYEHSMMQIDVVMRLLCELPIINIFIMTMFENKEEKGK